MIRFKSIGDIVFTLPAVHVVREHFPDARITFLTSKEHQTLIKGFADVDEVIAVDRALYRKGIPWRIVRETVALLQRLWRSKFSLVVDFQNFGETALLTRLTGAPHRWGPGYRGWAYTRTNGCHRQVHPVQWNLAQLHLGNMPVGPIRNDFVLPDAALEAARQTFAELRLDTARPAMFIQPFTSADHKNWPLENYVSFADHWRKRGMQVLFGGGPAERAALEPVRRAGYPTSAGAPLLVTAGLMKLGTLAVGGDTGLLHLAVALKKRVLMLMASAAPNKTHPFQHADWTLTPCGGGGVARITIEAAIEASTRAFAELGLGMDGAVARN